MDTKMPVHNHGPENGPGISCPEYLVDGRLVGECVLICGVRARARRRPGERDDSQDMPTMLRLQNAAAHCVVKKAAEVWTMTEADAAPGGQE